MFCEAENVTLITLKLDKNTHFIQVLFYFVHIFPQEQVKAPPATFNGLAKLVRRRIVARPDVEHLTVEDQQSLVKTRTLH